MIIFYLFLIFDIFVKINMYVNVKGYEMLIFNFVCF